MVIGDVDLTNYTGLVKTTFAVLGALATVIQLRDFLVGKRRKSALNKVLDSIADEHDATRATERLKVLQKQIRDIEHEQNRLESQLPIVAEQVYRKERINVLARSVNEQTAEIDRLARMLNEDGVTLQLDARLRTLIDASIERSSAPQARSVLPRSIWTLTTILFPAPLLLVTIFYLWVLRLGYREGRLPRYDNLAHRPWIRFGVFSATQCLLWGAVLGGFRAGAVSLLLGIPVLLLVTLNQLYIRFKNP